MHTFSIHLSYSILTFRKFHNSPGTKQITNSNIIDDTSSLIWTFGENHYLLTYISLFILIET